MHTRAHTYVSVCVCAAGKRQPRPPAPEKDKKNGKTRGARVREARRRNTESDDEVSRRQILSLLKK